MTSASPPDRSFAHQHLQGLVDRGVISSRDSILVTCGGPADERLLDAVGLTDHVISSLPDEESRSCRTFRAEDAERLSFPDGSFDVGFVHAGLHHCESPHRGLAELHRVARRVVIVHEAQDSALMRLFVRLGLTGDYEVDAVSAHGGQRGGVRNSAVPNYVYRWTRREMEKTVRSLAPAVVPAIEFTSEFHFHPCHLSGFLSRHPLTRFLGARNVERLAPPLLRALNIVAGRQGNHFAVVIRKDRGRPHSWSAR